ncbi:hypothetical protein [Mitsuokella multacida]|uniref:hypothetical protein n=1 Tax=Mitsuokella multacida TaxID=52226 RepID=UPI002431EE6E|nr:hypothetical protein [Mitsuokella multacida]
MSVLARKRKLSELKFYDNAIRLRRSMLYLLMRDLGAKRGVRDIKWMTKDMPPQDAELLLAVAERNGLKRFEADWPSWVIEKLRDNIWTLLTDMMTAITRAYTIFATSKAEADERRLNQDRAIACCESLLKELELAIDILPVDANKYKQQVKLITEEIMLLKGWRKAGNKKVKELEEQEAARAAKLIKEKLKEE